ncbi:MAG: transposase [Gammaproteobacteria bacterium]|nr:transposase [Gammaproteobacteria bacterium]
MGCVVLHLNGLSKKQSTPGFPSKFSFSSLHVATTLKRTYSQRFGSAANLNIHLHCLFLDGVYRLIDGKAVFQPVSPPTTQ